MTSKTENRILAIVVTFAFLCGAGCVAAYVRVTSNPAISAAESTLFVCEKALIQDTENDPTATDGYGPDATALLISAGWRGDPTDHSDRIIYSPGCNFEVTENGDVFVWDENGKDISK